MNVLLDTCAVLALARGELPRGAAAALRRAGEAWVSVVSAWEVTIKADAGKLHLKGTVEEWFQGLVERYDLRDVPLDVRTACAAAALPRRCTGIRSIASSSRSRSRTGSPC